MHSRKLLRFADHLTTARLSSLWALLRRLHHDFLSPSALPVGPLPSPTRRAGDLPEGPRALFFVGRRLGCHQRRDCRKGKCQKTHYSRQPVLHHHLSLPPKLIGSSWKSSKEFSPPDPNHISLCLQERSGVVVHSIETICFLSLALAIRQCVLGSCLRCAILILLLLWSIQLRRLKMFIHGTSQLHGVNHRPANRLKCEKAEGTKKSWRWSVEVGENTRTPTSRKAHWSLKFSSSLLLHLYSSSTPLEPTPRPPSCQCRRPLS